MILQASNNPDVRHRIDGLENNQPTSLSRPLVRHRIDGLETN